MSYALNTVWRFECFWVVGGGNGEVYFVREIVRRVSIISFGMFKMSESVNVLVRTSRVIMFIIRLNILFFSFQLTFSSKNTSRSLETLTRKNSLESTMSRGQQMFTKVVTYEGQSLALKVINKQYIAVTKEVIKEINQVIVIIFLCIKVFHVWWFVFF